MSGLTLESFGTHWAKAPWKNVEGGYVGHASWLDEFGRSSMSYCGHRHRTEDAALSCIKEKHEGAGQPGCIVGG